VSAPSPRTLASCFASLLALGAGGCTFGVSENTRTLTATGPESGWTVLRLEATPRAPWTIQVTGTAQLAPAASAAVTMVEPASGAFAPGEAVLKGTSLAFGAPVAQGAETALPLTLAIAPSVEELPRVTSLTLDLPAARGFSVDLRGADVSVLGVDGPLSVTTTDSQVKVSGNGTDTLTTSNGEVSGMLGGGVVTTNDGNVDLVWTGASDLEVTDSNAAVSITLPADAGIDYVLETSSDTITTPNQRPIRAAAVSGSLHGGGRQLHVTTSNGSIVLH
jgi:hypothetical protein